MQPDLKRQTAKKEQKMHYNCLMVDDETELAKMTCEYFGMFNVSCAYLEHAADCIGFLRTHEVDLVLLDINLKDESGFSLCRKIREEYDLPILFISARQSDDDIIIALNIGGDDYIKKPYQLSVLLAKVKVILKRMEQSRTGKKQKQKPEGSAKGLQLIEEKMGVMVNGRLVPLKAKEFALFQCLFNHRNTIVTKERLFDEVWGDAFYSDGTLNVHIRRLREKLEENPNEPKLIKTIWGTGYLLETGDGR